MSRRGLIDGGPELARRAAAEGLAAFALVFAGCGAIVADDVYGGALGVVGIALVFGLVITAMVYATGHLSGAHINPAVTIAFALTRHFPAREAASYIAAQLAGAVAAALALLAIWPSQPAELGATMPSVGAGSALVYEIVMTAFLMFVIMAVATDTPGGRSRGGDRNRRHGRPGRALRRRGHGRIHEPGPLDRPGARKRRVGDIWIYIAGPVIGAALGGFAYQAVRGPRRASAAPAAAPPGA